MRGGGIVTWLVVAVIVSGIGCRRQGQKISGPRAGSVTAEQSHQLMTEALRLIAEQTPDQNIFVGDRQARALREQVRNFDKGTPLLRRWLKTYQLAKAELHLGRETDALRLYEGALSLIRSNPEQIKPEILRQFYFDIAVAHLRHGETQNCCRQPSPASCILPIRDEALHRDQTGSRQAIRWLGTVLQLTDVGEPMHFAARWLMNLAHMTTGDYPSRVPAELLIPGLDESAPNEIREWQNVAVASGVATFSLAGGAVAEDFDCDGDMDLIVSSSDPRESLRVFWNRGDGTFADGTKAARVGDLLGGLNLTQTDYNNDGFVDLFVLRGGWLGTAGQHPNSLLRNNGDGTFTDVTMRAGLALVNYPTQTAAWTDYDLDGDLDVFVGNESTPELTMPCQLFRNEGDGTFVDVAVMAGVTNERLAKAVAWGDCDGDRYPDLYVSNYRGGNRLYKNQGDGTFVDVAVTMGVEGPFASFPAWFCDVDNDGQSELFVAGYAGGIAELAAALLRQPFDEEETLPRLYFRQGEGGGYQNRAKAWGLKRPIHPMGANFGDLSGNGLVDFYFGTGWPEYHELMPNCMYWNSGNEFEDVTNAARVGHLQKGHAVAMADFDGDGDLDVFEQMGGFVPGDKFYDVLFQNPTAEPNWLKVKLVGTESNRAAVGARIRVVLRQGEIQESLYRVVSTGGSFGANPLEQYFGLGVDKHVEAVEVYWPRTGGTDRIAVDTMNATVRIVEGASPKD